MEIGVAIANLTVGKQFVWIFVCVAIRKTTAEDIFISEPLAIFIRFGVIGANEIGGS